MREISSAKCVSRNDSLKNVRDTNHKYSSMILPHVKKQPNCQFFVTSLHILVKTRLSHEE